MLLNQKEKIIASPCVRNCCLDERDICLGCYRSYDEILQWSKVSNDEKKTILVKTEMRKIKRDD